LPAAHWASEAQTPGQAEEEPLQRYGEQEGAPVLPAASAVHVPTRPGRLQASQAPPQAALQQTPSTQLPLVHALPAAQEAPLPCLGTQAPFSQNCPEAQAKSLAQVVGHAAEAPLHTYGAQAGVPALPEGVAVHVPTLPGRLQASQAPAQAVSQQTPSTQLPNSHSLLPPQVALGAFFSSHCPLPLQKWPSAHWASLEQPPGQDAETPSHTAGAQEGLPASPAATGRQRPSLPAWLQASHGPPQAPSQHTPSTQWLLAHSSARVQALPTGSRSTQRPSWQKCVEAQRVCSSQIWGQAPFTPSQR
jgi:hypothetical protein